MINFLILFFSAEGLIKLQSIHDSSQTRTIKAHKGCVKSISFDPKLQYLASAGADGDLKIWDYCNGDELIATISGIIPASDALTLNFLLLLIIINNLALFNFVV